MKFKFIILVFLIALVSAMSCNSAKHLAKKDAKALSKAKAVFANHPLDFAASCAQQFPVKTFDSTPAPIIKKGKEIKVISDISKYLSDFQRYSETQRMHLLDSFKNHPFIVRVPCPPVIEHDPDTVYIDHYVTKESTALVEALRFETSNAKDSVANYRQQVRDNNSKIKKETKWIWLLGIGNFCWLIFFIILIILKIKKLV